MHTCAMAAHTSCGNATTSLAAWAQAVMAQEVAALATLLKAETVNGAVAGAFSAMAACVWCC
ncbi:hypothetical protein GCM10011273_27960 [Asticcacaulis endophyticus]|uniref:Uncharacterized protein n=1 Tax=Asticcacaulis endophyticus TaxID=1395890 RepID=A0A918QCH9_9CAUL|nr:hypothetical protein GCM10011273_27960 [Asticcacaulis endophyticus]